MVHRPLLVLIVWCSVVTLAPGQARAQYGATDGEWRSYGSDLGNTKYSPLDQIDATNFDDLRLAWHWKSADGALDLESLRETLPWMEIGMFQATPLMVGGTDREHGVDHPPDGRERHAVHYRFGDLPKHLEEDRPRLADRKAGPV